MTFHWTFPKMIQVTKPQFGKKNDLKKKNPEEESEKLFLLLVKKRHDRSLC